MTAVPLKIINQVEKKFFEIQEKRMAESSAYAEERHHSKCKFVCCGEHEENFPCLECGMTEALQDEHNDLVWALIDDQEAQSIYPKIEFKLAEWLMRNKK